MDQINSTNPTNVPQEGERTRYERIKTFYGVHREKIIYGTSLILMFLVGFGTGTTTRDFKGSGSSSQLHNTTKTTENTDTPKPPSLQASTPPPAPAAATTAVLGTADCPIKGNISGKNKIYHVRGGAFFERTQAEQCFDTEAEAQTAGFRASSR